MTLDEAMQWLASKGGKVHMVRRTADDNYYQVVIPPHRSVMIGVAHHGRTDVEPSDPNFEQAFIQMVEDIRPKVGA